MKHRHGGCDRAWPRSAQNKESTMSTVAAQPRVAKLKLERTDEGEILNVSVPSDIAERDFVTIGKPILELIRRLTNCTCMSGRIKVVLNDDFNEVLQVNLGP
jgi:hypothetical protein